MNSLEQAGGSVVPRFLCRLRPGIGRPERHLTQLEACRHRIELGLGQRELGRPAGAACVSKLLLHGLRVDVRQSLP